MISNTMTLEHITSTPPSSQPPDENIAFIHYPGGGLFVMVFHPGLRPGLLLPSRWDWDTCTGKETLAPKHINRETQSFTKDYETL